MIVDYCKTLNLPRTSFPMRARLPILEKDILFRWYQDGLYELIRISKENNKKIFLLHDGPPYANGRIHLGHAVNKVLKDIIIKFKGFSGYNAPYIPGWDCHGLPIELQVEQSINKDDDKVNDQIFRKICRQYVLKQIEIQKKDFIRLGVLGDWDNAYLTMDFKTEANIIRSFNKIIANGYIYKGVKPVYWCLQCCSALANLEVEYQNRCSYAVDFGFSILDKHNINKIFNVHLNFKKDIELIIWTTALWTIPANCAVAVHPDYNYQLIDVFHNKYIIVAAELTRTFIKRIQCSTWKVIGETLGRTLENIIVQNPIISVNVPVVLSNHVTLDSGTGSVHIAPMYGPDDYLVSKKYNLKNIIDIIDDRGFYLKNIHSELEGIHIFESNEIIIQLLCQTKNFLHINSDYKHSYPCCWRHKSPLIFRATSQWFLNINHNKFREKLLNIIQQVTWIPKKGYENIRSMIYDRSDWCISRQRIWGIPIPILVHKETDNIHPKTSELIEKIANFVEKSGIQAWWDIKVEDLLSSEEAVYYKKVTDTLDVWFDSGSTYDSVVLIKFKNFIKKKKRVDLYLEGSDQYRGWFMSSLIISAAINGLAPYKAVLSHGFTIDQQGRKMSKSIGNIISPKDIIDKFGSDILRLWIASSNYSKEMVISNDILQHITDTYRRIRNTIRFCLANLYDFDPEVHLVYSKNMIELDRWVVDHAFHTQLKIISNYEKYFFHNVVQEIMKFCSITMGSFYLDVIKDRQYTFKKDSLSRRSSQTALYYIVESMVRWIAPILSFTADEIWRYIPGKRSKSVFTEEWYNGLFTLDKDQFINESIWKIFFYVRNEINKKIEEFRSAGTIKGSLEADIILYIDSEIATKLRFLNKELAFGFLVSSIVILDYENLSKSDKSDSLKGNLNLKIILKKTKGIKCLRCWNYVSQLSQHQDYFNVCYRCVQNIIGLGEERKYF